MLNFKYNTDNHVYGMGAPTLHHYPPALGGNYPFSQSLQRPTSLGCVYGATGLGYPDWGLSTPHSVAGCGSPVSVGTTNIFSRDAAQTQGYRHAASPASLDSHPTQDGGNSANRRPTTVSARQGSCSGGVNPLTVVSSTYSPYGSTNYLAVTSSGEGSPDGSDEMVTEITTSGVSRKPGRYR